MDSFLLSLFLPKGSSVQTTVPYYFFVGYYGIWLRRASVIGLIGFKIQITESRRSQIQIELFK